VPVASAIFMALGTPERTPWLTAPLLPIALAGHMLLIPRYGAVGAAGVTTTVALMGASSALWWIHHVWRVLPPAASVARSCVVSAAAFMVSASWSTPGMLVLLKLPIVAAGALVLFAVLGEFDSDDASMAASVLSRERL
jgi:O-antigen/teichoic acid export membrane protein